MTEKVQFVDFGAPEQFGTHVFRVEISPTRTDPVCIIEDYGYRGLEDGIPRDEERVILPRAVWSGIAESVRRVFNNRLKAAKIPAGRWHTGTNLVERLLGKEFCVLAWAAETGLPEDTQRGWRRALFHSLSDGEKPPVHRKRRRPADTDPVNLSLFEAIT